MSIEPIEAQPLEEQLSEVDKRLRDILILRTYHSTSENYESLHLQPTIDKVALEELEYDDFRGPYNVSWDVACDLIVDSFNTAVKTLKSGEQEIEDREEIYDGSVDMYTSRKPSGGHVNNPVIENRTERGRDHRSYYAELTTRAAYIGKSLKTLEEETELDFPTKDLEDCPDEWYL